MRDSQTWQLLTVMAICYYRMRVPLKIKHQGKTYYAWIDEADYAKCCKIKWNMMVRGRHSNLNPFYVAGTVNKKWALLHRFVMGANLHDKKEVDHINRNPLDNTKANLRFVSRSTNSRNKTKRNTTSKYPGVSRTKYGKWLAQIRIDGKKTRLGEFCLEEVAARVYRDVALGIDPVLSFDAWNELK